MCHDEEEVLTRMGLLSRRSHFPCCYESLLEEDDSFCNSIILKASPGENGIHSVQNGMLLLSQDVQSIPNSPRVAEIKAYCEGCLLRVVARMELILFIINLSLQTIYPHRQRSRKHRNSKYTHHIDQFTCGGFSGV